MVTLTRATLHDLVWSKALSDVGADLGLSSVVLSSVCSRNDIPLPPPHYWRMVANGSPAKRRALPTEKFKSNHRVHLDSDAQLLGEAQLNPAVPEPAPILKCMIDDDVTDPAAKKLSKELQRAKKAGDVKTSIDFVEVNIGADSINRVANFLIGLQSKLDQRSWRAAGSKGGSIIVDEEKVDLLLSEENERVPHIPTRYEIRDNQRYGSWIPEHDIIRSGRLQLSITNATYLGVRQKWADGKRQRIEDILDSFIDGVQAAANAIKARRLEREEWHRQWEEEQRQRKERERLETIERVRGAVLRKQASAHEDANRLQTYIEAVKAKLQEGSENEAEIREWIHWAEDHAKRLDPLSNGLPILLSEEDAISVSWNYPKT